MWRLGVQCEGPVRDLVDSQRPHWRTSRLGQAAWEWKPELLDADLRLNQAKQWRQEEEQGSKSPVSG
jgi:hypothetical protein